MVDVGRHQRSGIQPRISGFPQILWFQAWFFTYFHYIKIAMAWISLLLWTQKDRNSWWTILHPRLFFCIPVKWLAFSTIFGPSPTFAFELTSKSRPHSTTACARCCWCLPRFKGWLGGRIKFKEENSAKSHDLRLVLMTLMKAFVRGNIKDRYKNGRLGVSCTSWTSHVSLVKSFMHHFGWWNLSVPRIAGTLF